METADIVLGLGFGDEGKGRTVAELCKQRKGPTCVVRFTGGHQAGHTVINDGVKHIHSNFASGAIFGLPSYFSEHCTIYPLTFINEKKKFQERGEPCPPLLIHPLAMVTLPEDVAYNRAKELSHTTRNGSCGLGVGATMKRHDTTPYRTYAAEMFSKNFTYITYKRHAAATFYANLATQEGIGEVFLEELQKEQDLFSTALHHMSRSVSICSYSALYHRFRHLIFEGSQGIMLDMDHGVFPFVTYGKTTSKNALEICSKIGIKPDNIRLFYITRCYKTRHGDGPLMIDLTEPSIKLINTEHEINKWNKWQDTMRMAEIDYDLLNTAIEIDSGYHNAHYHKTLVVTCMDQRPGFVFEREKIHGVDRVMYSYSASTEGLVEKQIDVLVND